MNTLVVFVKAPVPGRVKTRLRPPLSFAQAARLYRAFVKDTLASAAKVPGTGVKVAYAPSDDHPALDWIDSRARPGFFLQQGADLGRRLENAFAKCFSAGADKTVIIGSDTPHLGPGLMEKAFSALDRADVVLGPAKDGGYYLIGLRRSRPLLFENIPWSTGKVFTETAARARRARMKVFPLPALFDIDTASDLNELSKRFRECRSSLKFTRASFAALGIRSVTIGARRLLKNEPGRTQSKG